MTSRYENAKRIELESIIPIEFFRIVQSELHHTPCGITELPVTIEFNRNYKVPPESLVTSGGFVYGFVRMNEMLAQINGTRRRNGEKAGKIKHIYINDWDGSFLITIALNQGGEYYYDVSNEDVDRLLRDCRHPNL